MIEKVHAELRDIWRERVGCEPSRNQLALLVAIWADQVVLSPEGPSAPDSGEFMRRLIEHPAWRAVVDSDPERAVAMLERNPAERVDMARRLRRQYERLLKHPMPEDVPVVRPAELGEAPVPR